MEAKIDMIGIITNQFNKMLAFYRDVLNFKVQLEMEGNYAEFENPGVRFAISTNKVMLDTTKHPSYSEKRKGQSLELAFRVSKPTEVDETFEKIVEKGATAIAQPADMPWGQRAAFFADPDGNIHEIFANLNAE